MSLLVNTQHHLFFLSLEKSWLCYAVCLLKTLSLLHFLVYVRFFSFRISLQTLILKAIAFLVVNLSKISSIMMEMLLSFKVTACWFFMLYMVGLALNRNSQYMWIFPVISIQDGWEINLVLVENSAGVNALLLTVLFPHLCMSLSHNHCLKICMSFSSFKSAFLSFKPFCN